MVYHCHIRILCLRIKQLATQISLIFAPPSGLCRDAGKGLSHALSFYQSFLKFSVEVILHHVIFRRKSHKKICLVNSCDYFMYLVLGIQY